MDIRFIYKLLFAVSVALLSACQSNKSSIGGFFNLDTDINIEFYVDANINPNESGRPSPLFIRMYELKSNKMLKNAHFLDIFENDKEALGADLVVKHKLKLIKPGENRIDQFVLEPETKFVGLYAEFLNFKTAKYKLIIPVVVNNVFRNSVAIRVSGNELIFDEK